MLCFLVFYGVKVSFVCRCSHLRKDLFFHSVIRFFKSNFLFRIKKKFVCLIRGREMRGIWWTPVRKLLNFDYYYFFFYIIQWLSNNLLFVFCFCLLCKDKNFNNNDCMKLWKLMKQIRIRTKFVNLLLSLKTRAFSVDFSLENNRFNETNKENFSYVQLKLKMYYASSYCLRNCLLRYFL